MTGNKRAQYAELSILSPEFFRFFLEASAKKLIFQDLTPFSYKDTRIKGMALYNSLLLL
jgi:hypothetical protein